MKKEQNLTILTLLVIIIIFFLGSTIQEYWNWPYGNSISSPVLGSPTTSDTTTTLVYASDNSDRTTINDRLDSLDGGKKKEWDCETGFTGAGYPVNNSNEEFAVHVVVKTIGGETPQQLRYTSCTSIPESQWSVKVAPVNQ